MVQLGSTLKSWHIIIILFLFAQESFGKVDKLRCMWRDDPATSMVIGWNQISGKAPEICFGVIDGGVDTDFYPNCEINIVNQWYKGMNNHFARLTNLLPDTKYYFIIVDSEGTSNKYSFKTAPDDPYKRLSIIAGGDSRNYRDARVRANKMVAKLRPDFVLFGGDMTGGDTDREWKNWFDDWQHTIAADGHITPIVAARGNHEYSNATISGLFDVPSKNIYYSLRFGGDLLEIYTLNSLIASGGNQQQWLSASLNAAADVHWKMAQYHYAIRPHTAKKRERNNQMQHWGKLFYEHQVDLVFESDAHVVKTTWPVRPSTEPGSEEGFVRDDLSGTVYIGEGCWGAPLRRNNDDKGWTRASGSFNQFKWVLVDRDGVEIRTIATDNVDEVLALEEFDRFTPPIGLDIWNPPTGEVIYLAPRDQSMASFGPGNPVLVKGNSSKTIIDLDLSEVTRPNSEKLNFIWSLKQPLGSNRGVFMIQSQKVDGTFATLARVDANAESRTFNITLENRFEDLAYRLVYSHPGRQSKVFPMKKNFTMPVSQTTIAEKSDNTLRPDPNSGYLRVRYKLQEESDVDIRLVEQAMGAAIVSSKYQNQRVGNYLKSIDMSDYPQGDYQLVISINKQVFQEYKVTK